MNEFVVALVRFNPNGKAYPVNCGRFDVNSGIRVIVRWENQNRRLQAGEVVGTRIQRRACANSIVCYEQDAEGYGNGPYGVETLQDLHEFLQKSDWKHFDVATDQCDSELGKEYPTAYVLNGPASFSRFARSWQWRVHIGWAHSGVVLPGSDLGTRTLTASIGCSISRRNHDEIVDGKLRLAPAAVSHFDSDGGNRYREAAIWAEQQTLVCELDDDDDDDGLSQTQLRDILGGGVEGPVYLGDGEWL